MDYPGKVISGGFISGAKGSCFAVQTGNNTLLMCSSKSYSISLQTSVIRNALARSTGRLNYVQISNVLSQNKAYFNNGFSQDTQNIYLNKSALGLPTGLNLSLESLFAALLVQLLNNTGLGTDSKITCQWLSYGDKDGDMLYFTAQITFKKALAVVDGYETQPVYAISPLDF